MYDYDRITTDEDYSSNESDDDSKETFHETPQSRIDRHRTTNLSVIQAANNLLLRRDQENQRQRTIRSYEKLQGLYAMQTTTIISLGMKQFGKLEDALAYLNRVGDVDSVLCARDIPTLKNKDGPECRIAYKKKYIYGTYGSFFRYAHSVHGCLFLDEVVIASKACKLHFDIELKVCPGCDKELGSKVLWKQVKKFNEGLNVSIERGQLKSACEKIVEAYTLLEDKEFTDAFCIAGCRVMKCFVEKFIGTWLGERYSSTTVISGCRKDKFSLHVLLDFVYVDSSCVTMPLFVFEMARLFVQENTLWLVDNANDLSNDESKFRLIALRLSDNHERRQIEDLSDGRLFDPNPIIKIYFSGFNDSPFDEAIYTSNHLLRAVGSYKMSNIKAGCLVPYEKDRGLEDVMPGGKNFHEIFEISDDHLKRFKNCFVTCPMEDTLDDERYVLLTGLNPTKAYPYQKRIEGYKRKYWNGSIDTSKWKVIQNLRGIIGEYVENRKTLRDLKRITDLERAQARDVINLSTTDKERVELGEMFRSESGEVKPFSRFAVGEWFHHKHAGVEESTPSAHVFNGGFYCFGCTTAFYVHKTDPLEATYPFNNEEIVELPFPSSYIPQEHIEWPTLLPNRKFVVIDAPMGSGKTHQMETVSAMTSMNEGSVITISFRIFLARQQANRLGAACYKDLSDEDMQQSPPDSLVVVINSLWKLGPKQYDTVILDECGLLRRHCSSSTCQHRILMIMRRFEDLLTDAENVILLQDKVSLEDVQFFTEMCGVNAEDREQVKCFCFLKPTLIHPIKFTENFLQALHHLLQRFRKSIKTIDGRAQCTEPFMVFCSSRVIAEVLVCFLKEVGKSFGTYDSERVRGIWSSIKQSDDFCVRFSNNPNEVVSEADVLVCTSVIGAGVSITHHFASFHALLFCNILTHDEERQFIRRLRYVMEEDFDDERRQSFIFVGKGFGYEYELNEMRKFHASAREIVKERGMRDINISEKDYAMIEKLSNTSTQLAMERSYTNANHSLLWKDYGERCIVSMFEPFPDVDSLDEETKLSMKILKEKLNKYKTQQTESIAKLLRYQIEDEDACFDLDISTIVDDLEEEMMSYRQCESQNIHEYLRGCYGGQVQVAFDIIREFKEGNKKVTGNMNALKQLNSRVKNLVSWLQYNMCSLSEDVTNRNSFFNYIDTIQLSALKKHCSLFLAEYLLQEMLSVAGQGRIEYVHAKGSSPLYLDVLLFQQDNSKSLPEYLKTKFEACEGDSNDVKRSKKRMKHALLSFNSTCNMNLEMMYNDTKVAHGFVKRLMNNLGLPVRCGKTSHNKCKLSQVHILPEDIALCFCLKPRKNVHILKSLLPFIMRGHSVNENDIVLFEEAIQIYNKYAPIDSAVIIDQTDERVLPMTECRRKEYAIEKRIAEEQNVIGMDDEYEEEEAEEESVRSTEEEEEEGTRECTQSDITTSRKRKSTSQLDYLAQASRLLHEEERKEELRRLRMAKYSVTQEEDTIGTHDSIDSNEAESEHTGNLFLNEEAEEGKNET